ncbi:MAG: Calx-beta domain-containing protein, partial [Pseudomonadota bacterium]
HAGANNPMVNAIEILNLSAAPTPTPTVSISGPADAVESGDTGATTLAFTVVNGASQAVTATYDVTIAGVPSLGLTQLLSPGANTLSVPVPNDALANGAEAVTVTLTGLDAAPSVAVIAAGAASASAAVTEDDALQPLTITAKAANASEETGEITLTFSISEAPADGPITVPFSLVDATTTAGADYGLGQDGSVTFPAGDGSDQTVVITLINDADPEPTESFAIQLGAPSAAPATAVVSLVDGVATIEDFDQPPSGDPVVVYRVNAGGETVSATDGGPDWQAGVGDLSSIAGASLPGSIREGSASGPVLRYDGPATASGGSALPSEVPEAVFFSERWDALGGDQMVWTFDVEAGVDYAVRLYSRNAWSGSTEAGDRVFDVSIEGALAFDDVDLSGEFGHQTAGMHEFVFTATDDVLEIAFDHAGANNPMVNAIEILNLSAAPTPTPTTPPAASLADAALSVDEGAALTVTVTLDGPPISYPATVPLSVSFGATGDPAYDATAADVAAPSAFEVVITSGLSGTAVLPIAADGLVEGAESFTVSIDGSATDVVPSGDPLTVTINDAAFVAGYDEGVSGDLSSDPTAPDVITLAEGDNHVKFTLEGTNLDRDFFTVVVPEGMELSAIDMVDHFELLNGEEAFGAFSAGDGFSAGFLSILPPLGVSPTTLSFADQIALATELTGGYVFGAPDIGEDILDDFALPQDGVYFFEGFTAPLPEGEYTFWMNQGGLPTTSIMNFEVTPEAAATPPAVDAQAVFQQLIADRGLTPNDAYAPNAVGEAIVSINRLDNFVQVSNFGSDSFRVTNNGEKKIVAVLYDVSDAVLTDAVFDPVGLAGDGGPKAVSVNTDGDTGVFGYVASGSGTAQNDGAPDGLAQQVLTPYADAQPTGGGVAGYEGLLIQFFEDVDGGFTNGETLGFSLDMDPNSIAGQDKNNPGGSGVDDLTDPFWDVGGVSGAELNGAKIYVLFDDHSIAEGSFLADGSLGGAQALVTQDAARSGETVSLTVNGVEEDEQDVYDGVTAPSVMVEGDAGEWVRIVGVKGFNPVTDEPANPSQAQLDTISEVGARLSSDPFLASNIASIEVLDVQLSGGAQDVSAAFASWFEETPSGFASDFEFNLGFVAAVIEDPTASGPRYDLGDYANGDNAGQNDAFEPFSGLAIGPTTQPIHLVSDDLALFYEDEYDAVFDFSNTTLL